MSRNVLRLSMTSRRSDSLSQMFSHQLPLPNEQVQPQAGAVADVRWQDPLENAVDRDLARSERQLAYQRHALDAISRERAECDPAPLATAPPWSCARSIGREEDMMKLPSRLLSVTCVAVLASSQAEAETITLQDIVNATAPLPEATIYVATMWPRRW